MNLVYGIVTEMFEDNGVKMGKIRVGAAFTKVPLALVPEVEVGDTVLITDGVAVTKVQEETKEN